MLIRVDTLQAPALVLCLLKSTYPHHTRPQVTAEARITSLEDVKGDRSMGQSQNWLEFISWNNQWLQTETAQGEDHWKKNSKGDGMELWLLMVVSRNLANSLLARAGRPQSLERQWLTFRLLSSFPFLPPNCSALPFYAHVFPFSTKLCNRTTGYICYFSIKLFRSLSEASSAFPEYWIHWCAINLRFHHFVWL